jgi:hypothetical protein
MTDYNGWTNRETWLVALHFSEAEASVRDWDYVKEYIEEVWEEVLSSTPLGIFFSDYINFDLINWDEIKRSAYGGEEE